MITSSSFIVLWVLNLTPKGSMQVWLPSYRRLHHIHRPLLSQVIRKLPCCDDFIPVDRHRYQNPDRFLILALRKVGIDSRHGTLLAPNRGTVGIQNEEESGIKNLQLNDYLSQISSRGEDSVKLTKEFDQLTNENVEKEAEPLPEKITEESSLKPIRNEEESGIKNLQLNDYFSQILSHGEDSVKLTKESVQLSNENNEKATLLKSEKNPEESFVNKINDNIPVPKEPIHEENSKNDNDEDLKAYECSRLECGNEDTNGPVCACNHKTGNTVSFKNECDIKKHNCRFDTEFATILHEICPWQFESRSASPDSEDDVLLNYKDSRYYN